ncbi:mandelate racemase/muconate lactonizing enzyme family protein [Amycolatopsis acidiphila]|uniref:Mandelate racemase/muconate lactonizing enzyme family protein n=1 Tax=Amycolatopsis acidiphila TaxID=715473 RepID=A0A558AL75_9PSEU|nr:mandelate racemase/muconate lactonizing enzyme family protein [Amycolatopsis acidiphila]TVT25000.1 mandelate racemase/muconate lactonizing enzyme family protein [Amycolatopsis acidiphila]UIJ57493.1 mandelate racemase/muconate lactonizing enzyme family protein [Amycolatopsis acidiphila]GHG96407.1 mandelate racemase [Amycolatopsis acidiphila]
MRITGVSATPLGSPLDGELRWGAMAVRVKGGVVVRVTTDEGLEGIGEAGFSAEYFPTVGPIINSQLAPMLIGKDPRDIGALWQQMLDATHMWGRRGIETYAISGVDIALWDLLGKIADQPVYRLLGASKSSVRAYFAPSLKPTAEIVEECRTAVADGFSAIKLRATKDLAQAVELVGSVRDAVGPDVDLMVDANMSYDRRGALQLARELEALGVAWLEEPILSRSLTQYVDDHSWLADRVSLRLAGGESLLTRFEYIDLLTRRTFDVVQPDCTSVGGISEAKRVADLASTWNLTCVPHIACSSGTGVALAAGLHLILACENAPLIEVDAYGGPGWDGLLKNPLEVRDGYVTALDAPGIGVELSPDAYERFAVSPA